MTKLAMNREERNAIVQLRRWIPSPLPEGWTALQPDIVRVNDYGRPGNFARLVRSATYRLYFESHCQGRRRATLSNHTGTSITDAELEVVKELFFAGKTVTVSRLLPGLVHFLLIG